MKTNLFSRFRNLFRKAEPDYAYDDCYEDTYEDYSDVPVEEPIGEEEAIEDGVSAPTQSGGVLNLPHGAQASGAQPDANGIHVPLLPIVAGMPLELQSRVQYEVGDLCVFLPLDRILSQLSKGVVSLTFGELRSAAPSMFSSDRDQDAANVNVPLSAVLPHIGPDMLTRRHAPFQMDIPEDIVSPFADKGRGLAIGAVSQPSSAVRPASPTASRPPSPTPMLPQQPIPAPGLRALTPQPAPAAARIPQPGQRSSNMGVGRAMPQRVTPSSPASRPSGNGMPQPSVQPKPFPGAASHAANPAQPTHAAVPRPSKTQNGTTIIPNPALPKPFASEPATPAQGTPSVSSPQRSPLLVALSTVADSWPASLKQELIQLNLAEAKLAIPYDVVEAGLKRGRLSFAWRKVKGWIQPAPAPAVSVHDSAELELPLRVIAPLFIEQKKEQPQKATKVAVDKDIPNLFFGLPQPDTAGLAVDRAVTKPVDTNYYVWDDQSDVVPDDARNSDTAAHARTAGTEFVTRYATPNEVVSRAAALDGVEGAVISLPDGLMVASQLPSGLNGDTLAAFLPHIFGKVTHCTQELRMGELNNLNFTVGNVPWKIFRVNALYFAAFGAKGQPMPTARLAALASELDHKAKV